MGRFNILPKDIVLDILIRLPTKCVLRCKSVCKLWRDVVRHPLFGQMHLNRHDSKGDSGKLSFIFYCYEEGLNEFYYTEYDENCHETSFNRNTIMDLKPLLKDSIYSFDGSCNGLICFNESFEEDDVYICNPATREYIVLPKFEWEDKLDLLTGFGYIPSTNQYKVVRIHNTERDPNVGIIQVYTLGSGIGWRNAGTVNMKFGQQCTGAFANGALHWVALNGTITAFHLADERCSELPSPRRLISTHCRYVGVLGGFLSVTYYRYPSGVDVWLLKKNEDNEDLRWSKEFSFDGYIPQPFGIMKSGRILCYEQHKIYGYDLETSSVKMDVSFGKFIGEAIPHKNTLVSLKELGETGAKTIESNERACSSEEEKTMRN